MLELTRRQTVLGAMSAGAMVVAGCIGSSDSDDSNTSSNRTQDSITTSDITFDVSVEEQFTESHTARIHVSLANTLETPVVLSTGPTPPFTSYVSGNQSDESRLILVPDVTEDESPLDWKDETDPLPTSGENGCWNVTQEVSIEEIGSEIKLEQGETSNLQYDVYGYQNDSCPSPGTYQFEDTQRLYHGLPSDDTPEQELGLEFTIALDEDQSLSVTKADQTVKTAED